MSICSGGIKVRFAVLVVLLCGVVAAGGCAAKDKPEPPSAAELAINEYKQGAVLLESGHYEEAAASFRKALTIDDNNVLCHYSLALSLFRLELFEEAMAEADRALEIKPDYVEVYNIQGMIYNEQGQYLKAMECFRQLLDSSSYGKPWVAYYNLGFAAASAGNNEEALFYYSRALEQKGDYIQARQQRALMLERLQRESEAIHDYEMVLDALPESAEVHFSLGRLYFRGGKAVEARLNFEWVMRYAPGSQYSAQAARYLNKLEAAGH